jgi:tetratricopeptide (TPR) repeat protein
MRALSLAFQLIVAAGCGGRSSVAPRPAERPRLLLVTIDTTLFHDLAVAARDEGEAAEAMRAEEAALEVDPALPSAHNGRGLLLTDSNHHDDAALAFERAVHGDPTNASYWVNLGNARRAAGEMARARPGSPERRAPTDLLRSLGQ